MIERFTLPLDEKTDLSEQLIIAMKEAVTRRKADVLLLSGGVDSSLLAALDPTIPAITVGLQGESSDLLAAQKVAEHLGLDWHKIEVGKEEALALVKELIALTGSYDIGQLNDIAPFKAMKYAASLGMRNIRTGDFADTLFQGYGYLRDTDMNPYLERLIPNVTLASSRVASKMDLNTDYPYLDKHVVDVAIKAERRDNVIDVQTQTIGEFLSDEAAPSQDIQTWTKILLRRAALGHLPINTVYRTRTDLEFGSGMYKVEDELSKLITDEEIKELESQGFKYWNKAHAAMHKIFIQQGLTIPQITSKQEYCCLWCSAANPIGRSHCLTCGGWPADKENNNKDESK